MINVVIIDDEQGARELLSNMLKMLAPEFNILGEADGVETGLALIQNNTPDLVFLDIQMQDGTGFDLLSKLPNNSLKVIFVTAFHEHAIKAFEFSAIDYLLKPLTPDRLMNALSKVKKSMESEAVNIQTLLANMQSKDKKVVLKTSESVFVIDVADIIRCEAEGNYTTFFLNDGRSLLVSKIIKVYEDLLSAYNFFRSHQSHLVNMNFFDEYLRRDEQIKMKNGELIPLASRKKEVFLARLSQL